MLAFRQTRFCARGRDRFVDHLGMRGHCDRLRIAVATGACISHLAFLRASRLLGDSRSICMLMRRLRFLIGVAGRAGLVVGIPGRAGFVVRVLGRAGFVVRVPARAGFVVGIAGCAGFLARVPARARVLARVPARAGLVVGVSRRDNGRIIVAAAVIRVAAKQVP